MKSAGANILDVRDLRFSFSTYAGEVQAVRGVSFSLAPGETLGLVGESGCGKSVTAKSVIKLNPGENGFYKGGSICFNGQEVLQLPKKELLRLRAQAVRMIFQDPMTCLNPTMKIGKQITEGIINASPKIPKAEANRIALDTLSRMGIPNARERFGHYPHQYSGGMRQRVMIALAMAVNPQLLIADEPTTALDVTLQAQILALIRQLQQQYRTAIIMITHDLGVVASIASSIAVMYAGKILEYGNADAVFNHPLHPYTWGVMQSIPPLDADSSVPLTPIPGTPPDLFNPPEGCPFAARCPHVMKVCRQHYPQQYACREREQQVSCWLYHTHAPKTQNPITGKEAVL